jgi:CheY-like chemotaxis protein
VEDGEADFRWLARILSEAGYSVENAKTGAEALAKLKSCNYAAVLLNLILPDAGGWEILHAIRTDGPNQNMPVIVVTVVAEKSVSRGFPVQDYLVKPVKAEALMNSLRAAAVLPRPLSRRILVVDDDTRTLKLSKIALEAAGYEVVCHTEAANALEETRRAKFAAVVLDLLMPHMDGFQFLDRLREIEDGRNTPVIVWTNKDVTSAEMQRLKASAHEIALKGRNGIETVLKMLQRRAPAGATEPNTARTAQDNREPSHDQG